MEEEEQGNSVEDLHHELDVLETENTLNDKDAESRFIAWYDDICQERLAMLEAEENYKKKISELETTEDGYRRRIKELENSTVVLVKTFEEAQSEIKALREKYEPNTQHNAYLESYKAVAMERDTLLRSESKNKQRIKELETEVNQLRNYVKDFDISVDKNKKEQDRRKPVEKIFVITSTEQLNVLEKENGKLNNKLERLKRINKSIISRVKLKETKMKTLETAPVKKNKAIVPKEKVVINKKCVPTFLPKIENVPSGFVSDAKRTRLVPFVPCSSQTPTLMFGLGYRDIYRKFLLQRSKLNDVASLSSTEFDSISNYMI